MFILRKFAGARFQRVNAILETYSGQINNFINLIASTSYPFPEVVQALGTPLFVFPAEGLPGARYFPGLTPLDEVETRAEDLLTELFGVGEAYRATIQPHSGTQANQIVFNAVLEPESVVLSMDPSHGGHISHRVLIGRRNKVIHYHSTSGGQVDYERVHSLAREHSPRLIIAGGSSVPRSIDFSKLSAIAKDVGAYLHADLSHTALFVMTGLHPKATPHADFISFNMMKNLRGPCGGVLLYRCDLSSEVSKALFPGTQGGPIQNVLFAKLVALELLAQGDTLGYAKRMLQAASTLASALAQAGIEIVSKGTETHMVLVDLRGLGLTGKEGEVRCEKQRILANRNLLPNDPRPPWIGSGLRMGTACLACLSYELEDTRLLGRVLAEVLLGNQDEWQEEIDYLLKKYQGALARLDS